MGSLSSVVGVDSVNEVRGQFAHRTFDFPTDTTQPHLEVLNAFTAGVNRGNPDYYAGRPRREIVDNATWQKGKHSIGFGGDFSHVNTTESFPCSTRLKPTSAASLPCQCPFQPAGGAPQVIFFERFRAPSFTEPSFNPSVFQGQRIPSAIRQQAQGRDSP